jgi:RHS repeat-associated protein
VVDEFGYNDAFGIPYRVTANGSDRAVAPPGFFLNGQQWDGGSGWGGSIWSGSPAFNSGEGLYFNRARYYQPGLGRFIGEDPELGDVYQPNTLYRYLYASNDSVNHIDPSGRSFLIGHLIPMAMITVLATTPLWLQDVFRTTPYDKNKVLPDINNISSSEHVVEVQELEFSTNRSTSFFFNRFKRFDYYNFPQPIIEGADEVSAVDQKVTFNFDHIGINSFFVLGPLMGNGQADFSVRVRKFSEQDKYFAVETLSGHPLIGYRGWRVFTRNDKMVLQTFAIEHPVPAEQWKLTWFWGAGQKVMRKYWDQQLMSIANDDQSSSNQTMRVFHPAGEERKRFEALIK